VDEDILDLVCLLDLDGDTDRVDGRLDEHPLMLVAGDGERVQQHLRGFAGFDLGNVVAFRCLRGKVAEGDGRRQG